MRSDLTVQSATTVRESIDYAINGPSRGVLFRFHEISIDARGRLLALFNEFAWIVPTWCREVHVRMEDSGSDACGTCSVDRAYRHASIKVTPDIFDMPALLQRKIVCHELLHITLSPLQDGTRELIRELTSKMDETAASVFRKMQEAWAESVVSDLEFAICGRMEDAIVDRRDTRKARPKR